MKSAHGEKVPSNYQYPGPLLVTDRENKYILVAANYYFSEWPECWAIPDQEAKTIACWLEELCDRHGVHQALLTDQGKNFECKVISEICKLLKIEKLRTAYHP